MVLQPCEDRNYIIPDLLAFQESVAVQIANVDSEVSEPHVTATKFARHSKGCFAHVEQHLARESSKQPKDSQTILGHS